MLDFSGKMHFGADCFSLWFNKLLLLMALIQGMLQKIYLGKLLRGVQWEVATHLEKHLKTCLSTKIKIQTMKIKKLTELPVVNKMFSSK